MVPYNRQSFQLRALKSLYKARTKNDALLIKREARPDIDTGKVKKNVRFAFDDVDKNKKDEEKNKT